MATLRALQCLVGVIDAGSVTGAAERLHLSQPALSHHLAALEREVGTPLLERLPRGARATIAGRAVADAARPAIEAADRAILSGRAVAAGRRGRVRVGCAESLVAPVLATALHALRSRHPDVEVELEEAVSSDALDAGLAGGRLDLILGPRPSAPSGPVTVIGEEEIVAALPPEHRLAVRRRPPSLAEIAAEPLVHHHPDSGLRGDLDQRAAQLGLVLRPRLITRHAPTAATLAAAGLGPALVPAGAVPRDYPGVLRRLRPRLTRELVIVRRGTRDALVAELCELLVAAGAPAVAAGAPAVAAD